MWFVFLQEWWDCVFVSSACLARLIAGSHQPIVSRDISSYVLVSHRLFQHVVLGVRFAVPDKFLHEATVLDFDNRCVVFFRRNCHSRSFLLLLLHALLGFMA